MVEQHSSIVRQIRDLAIYTLVIYIGFIVRQLPRKASLRFGSWIGDTAYRFIKRRRQIALRNLKMALGSEKGDEEIKKIAQRSFQNMGKVLVEFLSTPGYSAEHLQKLVRIQGEENIRQAANTGKGVVGISAHFGNWELIFQVMSALKFRPAVIVQPFKNQRLDKLVNSYRAKYGVQIIRKEAAPKQVLRSLRDGLPIAFMSDQNAGDAGVFVDFFGIPASTPKGPVMFALRTGAVVVNLFDIRQADDSHLIIISEPVNLETTGDTEKDIEINTARLAKTLEYLIRKYPCQWLWMHNRWKTRPHDTRDPVSSDTRHPESSIQKSVLVLSDRKPGHYNQSLGIMDRMRDIKAKTIEIKFKQKWRDNVLRVSTRLIAHIELPRGFMKAMLKWALESSSAEMLLKAGSFDAILSTGSSIAAPNILLGKLAGAKTIVCTRPSPVGINHFHLAILPEHTRPRRKAGNVIMTLGVPNRITPEKVRIAGDYLAEKLNITGQRIIGVLLGGDDRYYHILPAMVSSLCDSLIDICKRNNIRLALTTSRRTNPEAEDVIRSRLQGSTSCCYLVLASEPQEENPVPGILGISNVTIVTEDSFSMVCEAASSGRKVVILETGRRKQGHPKRQRAYHKLVEHGYARKANVSNLRDVILDSLDDSTDHKVLDDAKTAANAMRKIIMGL